MPTEYASVTVSLDSATKVEQKLVSYFLHDEYLEGSTAAAEEGWLVQTATYDTPHWLVVYRRAVIPEVIVRPLAPPIPTISRSSRSSHKLAIREQ